MQRRRYLAALAAAVTGTGAGCAGTISESDGDPDTATSPRARSRATASTVTERPPTAEPTTERQTATSTDTPPQTTTAKPMDAHIRYTVERRAGINGVAAGDGYKWAVVTVLLEPRSGSTVTVTPSDVRWDIGDARLAPADAANVPSFDSITAVPGERARGTVAFHVPENEWGRLWMALYRPGTLTTAGVESLPDPETGTDTGSESAD